MIVQRFLEWAPTASAGARAEGAGALARAFLYSGLTAQERGAAEAALTLMLDDPHADVRRNIAEALAPSPFAPRHIVLALSQDTPEVAVPVLMQSPVLRDADLIELLAVRGEEEQAAVAARTEMSPALTAALAEIAGALACVVLARNPGAAFTCGAFSRLVERHGGDPDVRNAMLDRADLPIGERQRLLLKLAQSLGDVATRQFRMGEERARRMTREATERATLQLAGEAPDEVSSLVTHLRESGQLTTGLVLRALLLGDLDFVHASFAELCGVGGTRLLRMTAEPLRPGFRSLYRQSRFPAVYLPLFQAALLSWRESEEAGMSGAAARRQAAERALDAANARPDELGAAIGLLNRIVADAARDEARERLQEFTSPLRLAAA